MTKIVRKGNVVETFKGKFISKCIIAPFISGVVRCDRIYSCESKKHQNKANDRINNIGQ